MIGPLLTTLSLTNLAGELLHKTLVELMAYAKPYQRQK